MIKRFKLFKESLSFKEEVTGSSLPKNVINKILSMASALNDEHSIGDTSLLDGYHIETHTLGCRIAADTSEDDMWDEHYTIYDEYVNDGISSVFGDPSDGIFVTVTPTKVT